MNSSDDTLRTLVDRSFSGEQASYRQLLRELRGRLQLYVRNQLRRAGRGDAHAEDIVQEAMIAIHTRWHTYDRNLPLLPWAYSITRYKLIDFLRSTAKGARDRSLDELTEGEGRIELGIDAALTIDKLVSALPSKFRQPIELVRLAGLSVKEAAAILGSSESSVKVNVHRGVKAIALGYARGDG